MKPIELEAARSDLTSQRIISEILACILIVLYWLVVGIPYAIIAYKGFEFSFHIRSFDNNNSSSLLNGLSAGFIAAITIFLVTTPVWSVQRILQPLSLDRRTSSFLGYGIQLHGSFPPYVYPFVQFAVILCLLVSIALFFYALYLQVHFEHLGSASRTSILSRSFYFLASIVVSSMIAYIVVGCVVWYFLYNLYFPTNPLAQDCVISLFSVIQLFCMHIGIMSCGVIMWLSSRNRVATGGIVTSGNNSDDEDENNNGNEEETGVEEAATGNPNFNCIIEEN